MRKKAFTLMELLVVIAIIALLMAIMTPALGKAKQLALRLTCASGLRQISLAAVMAAGDNRDRLPKGGFQYKPPGIAKGYDFDDAIQFRAEDYLFLTSYMANLKIGFDPELRCADDVIREAARKIFETSIRDVFCCPALQKLEYPMNGGAYSILGESVCRMPFIHNHGGAGWTTRIGYSYVAGFENNKWEWTSFSDVAQEGRWRSADRTSDKGDSVVIAERTRYTPQWGNFIICHGPKGYQTDNITPGTPADEAVQQYRNAYSNVSYLDGSVKSERMGNLEPRIVTVEDNKAWWYTGEDFCYF